MVQHLEDFFHFVLSLYLRIHDNCLPSNRLPFQPSVRYQMERRMKREAGGLSHSVGRFSAVTQDGWPGSERELRRGNCTLFTYLYINTSFSSFAA